VPKGAITAPRLIWLNQAVLRPNAGTRYGAIIVWNAEPARSQTIS
jgi:hypothetical protein